MTESDDQYPGHLDGDLVQFLRLCETADSRAPAPPGEPDPIPRSGLLSPSETPSMPRPHAPPRQTAVPVVFPDAKGVAGKAPTDLRARRRRLYYYSRSWYQDLLDVCFDEQPQLLEFVRLHPHIITRPFKDGLTVFDFFYDKAVKYGHLLCHSYWTDVLLQVLQCLSAHEHRQDVYYNSNYLYRLQSTQHNFNRLFKRLLAVIEVHDWGYLVSSVVARGELGKLRLLYQKNPEGVRAIPHLVELALYYGRVPVLEYLAQLPGGLGGAESLSLPNLQWNARWIYHGTSQPLLDSEQERAPISGSSFDVVGAIRYVISWCRVERIPVHAIRSWIRRCSNARYYWEQVSFESVYEVLCPYIKEPVPLTEDFGEYNAVVFGPEWSHRSHLVERLLSLQARYDEACDRLELIHDRYRDLVNRPHFF